MNTEVLNRLLEKYYNGKSTEKEEEELKEFFTGNAIPEGYEAEREMFGYFKETGKIPEPSVNFETRIMAAIDSAEIEKPGKKGKSILPYLSAAAGILLLAASYFFLINRTDSADSFKNPEIAYAETMKILMDVSSKLNHAAHSLEPVGKINKLTTTGLSIISKPTSIIARNLRNLEYLNNATVITGLNAEDKVNK